ncbi:hypothetical protein BDF22DRAFT_746210 [Syncephalis plumigaleata]|nr:hypothetical protein BDF22DRAFT_746210 [Syncephalis plumigaleata]
MSLDQTVSETLATVPNPLDTTKLSIQNEYQEQGASVLKECNGDIFSASTLKALRPNDITNIKRQFSNDDVTHWFLHQSLAGVCYNAQNVVFTDIRQALSKDTLPKNPVAIDAINMTFFTILSTLYKSPFLPSDPKAVINAENENKGLEIKP